MHVHGNDDLITLPRYCFLNWVGRLFVTDKVASIH